MKKTRYSKTQIIKTLKKVEARLWAISKLMKSYPLGFHFNVCKVNTLLYWRG